MAEPGPSRRLPLIEDVHAAVRRIDTYVATTPVVESPELGALLKLETVQPTGSFKVRGAFAALTQLEPGTKVLTASAGNRVVAEVRSAVDLDDDQKRRLAASLKQATGKDVDIVVVIDPSVMGGVVTQIGDTVIDGSIRARLSKLRESF